MIVVVYIVFLYVFVRNNVKEAYTENVLILFSSAITGYICICMYIISSFKSYFRKEKHYLTQPKETRYSIVNSGDTVLSYPT